jgi:hypothetical protein
MQALPAILLVSVQVAIGLYLGFNYLNGDRNKPALIGAHLLLGAVALEVMALLLRGAPSGAETSARPVLTVAAGLTAAALLTGLAGAMFYKPMPKTAKVALYSHAVIGLAAFVALSFWVARS